MEQQRRSEELLVTGKPLSPSPASHLCQDKKHFMVTKTKNFDQCTSSPILTKLTGISTGPTVTHASVTSAIVCGELSDFVIRKVMHKQDVLLGLEAQSAVSHVVMDIIKVQSIKRRLPIPSVTKVIDTLVFAYPGQPQESALDAEIVLKTESLLGVRPVLPQPGLMEAPVFLIPIPMPANTIVTEVLQLLIKASEIIESPEQSTTQADLAGIYSTLFSLMRKLSFTDLEKLEKDVISEASKSVETVFYHALAQVGTNPSTMLVIKKVKTGSLPTSLLAKIIPQTIRSVRHPTKALMTELVKMVKLETVKSDSQLLTTTLAHLSNLVYTAYVHPTTMVNSFPTRVYGIFGDSSSSIITVDLIPFLVETLETTESEHVRLVVISSLGKLGHLDGLTPLLKVKEHLKPVAILSMKHIALMNPTKVRPILMAIITNPVESADIRIASTSILPFTNPSVAELQRLATLTWFEPSKQVTSFIISTIRSLATTSVPDLKTVGIKAESVLPLLKTETFGIQYSRNTIFSQFVTYLKSVATQQMILVNNKESIFPRFFSLSTFVGPAGTSFQGHSFEVYTTGMDYLLEKFAQFVSGSSKTSGPIRQQLDEIAHELMLKTRQMAAPTGFLKNSFFGMETSAYLDTEAVMDIIADAASKLETHHSAVFSHLTSMNLVETNLLSMSSIGLPMVSTIQAPVVVALKGSIVTKATEGKLLPNIIAKIIPVFHGKIHSVLAVMSPITQELIATGAEMSLHTSLPIEIEADVVGGEVEVILRNPVEVLQSERPIETIHGHVIPFTAILNATVETPLMSLPTLKTIASGTPASKIELPIGGSLGLSMNLRYQSEATSLFSYLRSFLASSPMSLPFALLPTTLRHSSVEMIYNPALSPAKELKFALRLTTKSSTSHPLASLTHGPINRNALSDFSGIVRSLIKSDRPSLITRGPTTTTVVEIMASSTGPSFSKTAKAGIMAGIHEIITGKTTKATKAIAAIEIVPSSGSSFMVALEGKVVMPVLMHRWNIVQLLKEPLQYMADGKLTFERRTSPTGPVETVDIEMAAVLEKTEAMITSLLASTEYKTCLKDMSVGSKLTPICQIVQQQAASLDHLKLTLKTPAKLASSSLGLLTVDFLKSIAKSIVVGTIPFGGSLSYGPTHLPTLEGLDTLEIDLTADRESTLAQATISTPGLTYSLKNIHLLSMTKTIFPLTILDRLPTIVTRKLTGDLIPSTCRVEPTVIRTFDNKTIDYTVNDCEHVLLTDGSGSLPIAVSTRTTTSQKKAITILSGITKVIMAPSTSSMVITVNGKPITIPSGEVVVEKTSNGFTTAIVRRFVDNVFEVTIPSQMLTVRTDGVSVEIVAPQLLRSRALGLCGDMNGEVVADLKTPRMCVMEPRLAAISFMLNKAARSSAFPQCSGAPAKVLAEFEAMNRICPQESVIPTPILKRINSGISL